MILLIFFGLAFLLGLLYNALIAFFLYFWKKVPLWGTDPESRPETRISVIISARNEADNIEACLNAVFDQTYPLHAYEVIVVDDHSTDDTAGIVESLGYPALHLLRLAEHLETAPVWSYKKKAIELGIDQAKGELIVCTDADCLPSRDWLTSIAAYYEAHHPAFISAPVVISRESNALERFQSLDLLGTMVLTGAGIQSGLLRLANGANLAYPKAVFRTVGGFAGVDHLASGDDMLLLQKIAARFPDRIAFLKDPAAVVRTAAEPDLRSFFNQRTRWATKALAYPEDPGTIIWIFVFAYSWITLLSPLLAWWLGTAAFAIFFLLLLMKSLADFQLLRTATRFFNRPSLLRAFPMSQFLHLLYVALIGILANVVKRYQWKGRTVE